MDFSDALCNLKAGMKMARSGWNGNGMWIVLQAGYPDGIAINGNTSRATGIAEGTVCSFRPYLMMRTAQHEFVPWVSQHEFVPWIASQTDLLAEDWEIVNQ
jgi:hypothetical protein